MAMISGIRMMRDSVIRFGTLSGIMGSPIRAGAGRCARRAAGTRPPEEHTSELQPPKQTVSSRPLEKQTKTKRSPRETTEKQYETSLKTHHSNGYTNSESRR